MEHRKEKFRKPLNIDRSKLELTFFMNTNARNRKHTYVTTKAGRPNDTADWMLVPVFRRC